MKSLEQKSLKQILIDGDQDELLALFSFDKSDSNEKVILKFNLWSRHFFPKYFSSKDAGYHKKIDEYNLKCYRGQIKSFTDIVYRDGAKTTRTKLFFAFAIPNDRDHFRKYLKILSKDLKNSTQSVTDIYNILVTPRIVEMYPATFRKTVTKREETMSSFTTATGIKLTAGTVGTDQRGQLQDEARPDLIWFDDFETRKSLRSAVETQSIWDNMEEARTGLSQDGACIYTCNYISERGNVHKLIGKENSRNVVINIPIIKDGKPTWDRYTVEEIKQIELDTDDFAGEYLGDPSAGGDVLFDRGVLNDQDTREVIEELAGLNIFYKFDPSSRYASGHDVAGGVELDHSTTVIIDFDTIPARVVATFKNNTIKPETFGDEIKRHADIYGSCLVAPEKNNHGHATIARLKQIYPIDRIHKTQLKETKTNDNKRPTEYGWHTNGLTKSKMMYALAKAVEKGLLNLSDKHLINEAKSYSRDDLMDIEIDPRLSTRHFDLLIACAIAWQMKDFAIIPKVVEEVVEEEELLHADIGI